MTTFFNFNPVILSLIFGSITFLITSLGSLMVYIFKIINDKYLNYLTSFSYGIILSSTFFSLLLPALDINKNIYIIFSVLLGSLSIYLINLINKNNNINLILSISIHNIPEGLIIGIAFGLLFYSNTIDTFKSALMIVMGIGIQNFPEGYAVSIPLKKKGYSYFKSFVIGSLVALPELISAVIGCILVSKISFLISYILSYAFGCMLYATLKELNDNKENNVLLVVLGFTIMMIFDLLIT